MGWDGECDSLSWAQMGSASGYHGLGWGVQVAIKDWDGECRWLSWVGMGSVSGYHGLGCGI